jgi:WD40 repeat protein
MSRHKREIVDIKSLDTKLISADSKLIKIYDLEKEKNVDGIFFKENSSISSIDFVSKTVDTLVVGDSNVVKIYDLRLQFNNFPQMQIELVDQVNKVAVSGEYIGNM